MEDQQGNLKPAGAYQCRINFCQEDSRYLFKITILREVLFFLLKKLSSTFKWQVKLKAVSPQCSLVSAAGISSLLQLFPPYVCWCRLLPLGFRLRHLCGLGSKDGELCPRGKMLAARTVTTQPWEDAPTLSTAGGAARGVLCLSLPWESPEVKCVTNSVCYFSSYEAVFDLYSSPVVVFFLPW